jgi:hypothetical protein
VSEDRTGEHLDIYDTRNGWWNPDLGEVELPDGWELLPRGDTFVTRRVKAAGKYWLVWSPRTRNRPHRTAIGLLAPTTAINEARGAAEATAEQRARRRTASTTYHDRHEERYRKELAAAIVTYLDFAPKHALLADQIAERAAARAGEVGSGRVGRTRLLSLDERAKLAARADIRHNHTSYEQDLDDVSEGDLVGDAWLYREIKSTAHVAVDDFIDLHRKP